MIVKSYEIEKLNLKDKNIFLLYGDNFGQKDDLIKNYFIKSHNGEVSKLTENEIINNFDNMISALLNSSLFEDERLIIISQSTHRIINFVVEIQEREIENLKVVLVSDNLDKKSKLRNLFEKEKKFVCVPFYEENNQSLSLIANNFFKNKQIKISREVINLIVERCSGDRGNLKNELNKIENFIAGKNSVKIEDIISLTNTSKNYSVNELVDNYLSKNSHKINRILNENLFSNDDCILILRTVLTKLKRLLILRGHYENNQNIDNIISSFKPPIFWKDKDIVRKQIQSWSLKEVQNLIYKTSDVEILVKKNSSNSVNFVKDFVSNYK